MSQKERWVGVWLSCGLALLLLVCGSIFPAARASEAASPAGKVPDAKVQQFLDLLADPDVRQFLAHQRPGIEAAAPQPEVDHAMAASLGDRLQGLRNHLADLAHSTHDFASQEQAAYGMALDALQQRGLTRTALSLAAFVILGLASQALFHLAGSPFRRWLLALKLDTVNERLQAVFARLLYGLGLIASFTLGSIGAFLLFDWPALIKALLLGFLVAFVILRIATVVGRFLLAPGAVRFRVVPIPTAAAWYFYIRLVIAAAVLSFGGQFITALGRFGFSPEAMELSTDALGLFLVLLGWETVWRMPPLANIDRQGAMAARRHRGLALLVSVGLAALWVSAVAQATLVFHLVAFAMGLPLAAIVARASVAHILRPAGADIAQEDANVQAVLFARGVRNLVIVSAALLLAWTFDIDIVSLTMRDTIGTRLLRGAISVIVIILITDFLWTLIRAIISQKLSRPLPHGTGQDAGHLARLQTLLPIVSNILLATLAIVAAMMCLAALGVEIGPLIASAGVVGVAIGFGAQTLVKDVISGIFYLVDDAFRIGEYIQSGSYKGTVESFSLRSVKLRHQRGALYTVPFGVLGAVQNQSRDWAVDKIAINVPYGTDLDRVRKLIKRVGAALGEDPEFGPEIISPLKMQGVSQFGDFAIQIQTKMTTKPGDVQFMARRRALLLIKQAFEANGIGFAVPTVQVAGDSPAVAAAAGGLALVSGKAAE